MKGVQQLNFNFYFFNYLNNIFYLFFTFSEQVSLNEFVVFLSFNFKVLFFWISIFICYIYYGQDSWLLRICIYL